LFNINLLLLLLLLSFIGRDNPISGKVLESMLTKLNCRCVVVTNGADAIGCAMGDVKFDIIFMAIQMPLERNSCMYYLEKEIFILVNNLYKF